VQDFPSKAPTVAGPDPLKTFATLIDKLVLYMSLLGLPPVLIAISRATTFGWRWGVSVQVVAWSVIMVLLLFRRRLSFRQQNLQFLGKFDGLCGGWCHDLGVERTGTLAAFCLCCDGHSGGWAAGGFGGRDLLAGDHGDRRNRVCEWLVFYPPGGAGLQSVRIELGYRFFNRRDRDAGGGVELGTIKIFLVGDHADPPGTRRGIRVDPPVLAGCYLSPGRRQPDHVYQ
jgi:hypothetical protein